MIAKGLRKAVLVRDGYRCHYCDEKLYPHDRDSTIDHKVPKCLGGTDAFENLLASCSRCNFAKGDMSYQLFLSIWRESLERGGNIKTVEAVCAVWKQRSTYKPATQWNAVLAGCC